MNPNQKNKDGFINLFKPCGMTSFDCIRRLRRILGIKKMGHLGTLDPAADGVLPVAAGKATRLISYLEGQEKKYVSTFLLGTVTDTDDMEGKIIRETHPEEIPLSQIEKALLDFIGEIQQVPPSVSAVKVAGERAYKLAREGRPPELKPRKVKIFSIKILDYRFPLLKVEIYCGSGVYVRSVARDLGEALGCGAAVSDLKRTMSGAFLIENSVTFDEIEKAAGEDDLSRILIDFRTAMSNFPVIIVNENGVKNVFYGRAVSSEDIEQSFVFENKESNQERVEEYNKARKKYIITDRSGNLLAVARIESDGIFAMEKVLVSKDSPESWKTEG